MGVGWSVPAWLPVWALNWLTVSRVWPVFQMKDCQVMVALEEEL